MTQREENGIFFKTNARIKLLYDTFFDLNILIIIFFYFCFLKNCEYLYQICVMFDFCGLKISKSRSCFIFFYIQNPSMGCKWIKIVNRETKVINKQKKKRVEWGGRDKSEKMNIFKRVSEHKGSIKIFKKLKKI